MNRFSLSKSGRRILLGGVILIAAISTMRTRPTNRAETRTEHEDATMRTRIYAADISTVREFLAANLASLRTYGRAWRVVSHDENSFHCEVPVLIFTDDLQISLQVLADNQTQLDVRSASRVGKGDFGENRRHILQLLELLDKKFAE